MLNKINSITTALGIAFLLTIGSMITPVLAAQPVSIYVVAHSDDWPLFMNPAGSASSQRLVFIVTTATGAIGYPHSYDHTKHTMPEYQAVEEGQKAAQRFVADLDQPYNFAVPRYNWVVIGNHWVLHYAYRNTATYFLRLPDGGNVPYCSGGSAATPYINKCLASLSAGVGPLTSVDGWSTYSNWTDLVNTIYLIMKTETVGASAVGINSHDPDPSANEFDNPDHYKTGDAAMSAAARLTTPVPGVWLWCGYAVGLNPPNLLCDATTPIGGENCSALVNKSGTYAAMTAAIAASSYAGYWDPSGSPASRVSWLSRVYGRMKDGPQNYCGAPHR